MRIARWVAALVLLSASAAAAQDLRAKTIQVPQSRSFDNPPNWGYDPIRKRLLLGIEAQGLFASQDGGESWMRIDDGSYHAATSIFPAKDRLIVNPHSGDLYSLPRSQGFTPLLYRSDDGGGRWTGLLPDSRSGAKGGNQPVAGEAVSPEVHRLLFVPGKPGLAYSTRRFPTCMKKARRCWGIGCGTRPTACRVSGVSDPSAAIRIPSILSPPSGCA
jgi:hypothetical protein